MSDDVGAALAALPTRDQREPVVGQGEGGDDTTVIDRDAEAAVVARLEELHAGGVDFRLVSEELGERMFGSESKWVVVVDPIDGSLNAKRCLPFWCISLAFADGPTLDDVRFGYIRDFGTGEEWVAQRGLGATVDGRELGGTRPKERLGVVDLEATNAGLVADAAARLDGHVGRIRVLGALALALCQLADGRVDGVATLKPSRSVDLAAAALIVREAGASLVTWDLESVDLGLESRPARSPRGRDVVRWPANARLSSCAADGRQAGSAYTAAMIAEQSIREALRAVIDPEIRRNVVELEMVRGVQVRGDHVDVTIALTVAGCPMKADLEGQVRQHVGAVEGVSSVGVAFDVMSAQEKTALRQRLQPGANGGEQKSISLSSRTRVIALASGKGGVGKSTVSSQPRGRAGGRRRRGRSGRRGHLRLLDPAHARRDRRPVVVEKMIVPPVSHDLRVMSIGFFLESDGGRRLARADARRALEQFLTDVHWGELDYLVVDMPPGTGDVAISLGQLLPSPSLIIVTTPQPAAHGTRLETAEVAEKDGHARRGRCREMSFVRCACCGEVSHPFGAGGGRALADELGVPLLAEIPLDEPLREAADSGTPLVLSAPDAESAQAIIGAGRDATGSAPPPVGAERISRRLGVLS